MILKRLIRKEVLIELLISLCIILFVYAAISKLLDFETFKAQIGQSPVLSSFTDWIVWIVPISELVVAVLLIVPNYRLIGLISFYSIMVMFTTYIIVILKFSDFIPCSCGGLLESLGWNQHLIMNVLFCLLALYLLFNLKNTASNNINNRYNQQKIK
ncbi:MauE/DoxX family redox-associated membrane protein [Aureibaculum sp. 2210JD6-5]|uniref:MauE/DoxX family redox-associated membrane protein n=1 Tax=Aureibaculum sp. 2210JD6-5 TaxID=3103957 RepID=UPI0039F17A66